MALNRDFLQQNNIWFPLAGKRERHLLQGQGSPRNAQGLTDALNTENNDEATQILGKHLAEAQARGCQKVLLSNELLMLALSQDNRVEIFQQIVQAVGFSRVYYFLLIRDPVDQALSLYKHRAKAGIAPDIEEWSAIHYHYGTGLKNFLQQAGACDLYLRCRKYGNQLDHIFFREWLDIAPDKLKKPKKRVNPSLSISELLLIRQAREKDAVLPRLLYNAFLHLPKNAKAQEPRIKDYYKAVLSNALTQYMDTWKICNQHLPEDTPIQLPKQQAVESDKVMTFTAQQGEVIAQLMQQLRSPYFLMRLMFLKYKRKLGKLRNVALRK